MEGTWEGVFNGIQPVPLGRPQWDWLEKSSYGFALAFMDYTGLVAKEWRVLGVGSRGIG